MKLHKRGFFHSALIVAGISLSIGLSACSSPKPVQQESGTHRYPLTGRVVSVEKQKQQVVVDAADIPGFMMAMTMGYDVKNPNLLESISAGDQIKGDVVVDGNDVWLENIVVVKKADQVKAPPSNDAHPAPAMPSKQ